MREVCKVKKSSAFIASLFFILFCSLRADAGEVEEVFDAARRGDIITLKVLIARSPKLVNARESKGGTPLQVATGMGNRTIIKYLLANGADVNAHDNDGETALHIAAVFNRYREAPLLIEKGADVNAKDNSGLTPLHQAASRGYKKVIVLLLSKGADVNALTKDGRSPTKMALLAGKDGAAKYLRAHGGKD
jgi:ankyrin repeat protein